MISLKLIRTNPKDIKQEFTIGELFVRANGGDWLDFGFTLEDQTRDINKSGSFDGDEKKVYGETSIPFGKYKGQITYSPAFKRALPLIKNVKHFEGIRIHSGNTIKDTFGCILLGYKTDHKGKIWESSKAVNDLINLITQNDNEAKFIIEIT